jgi:hypothetical protein
MNGRPVIWGWGMFLAVLVIGAAIPWWSAFRVERPGQTVVCGPPVDSVPLREALPRHRNTPPQYFWDVRRDDLIRTAILLGLATLGGLGAYRASLPRRKLNAVEDYEDWPRNHCA